LLASHIISLSEGDLGPTSYREIYITEGDLTTIGPGALSGSYTTLSLLHLYNNRITSFPSGEITSFIKLASLRLQYNELDTFPIITSDTLELLDLSNNPLGGIPSTALSGLTALVEIQLEGCSIPTIPTDTFTGVNTLQVINLNNNLLSTIPAGAVHLEEADGTVLLNNNYITDVAVGALQGVTGTVSITNNRLPELNDPVWRPLFDDGIVLYAANNPLTCGCGIAWLVVEFDYQTRLGDDITCSDGELVVDLDPDTYNHCR
ncbi:oplophorus-luciferin 2-monooxygenase non-catalytic subunit, partial [Procambarus clarkii]|uniref:oplophorus-luciferin 2-monooxygenase non-catalytic subunit n=1 Tax=Procambarus clarkii TaxID=6728 RepID=UPI0037422CA2